MSLKRYAPLWAGLAALGLAYLLAWGLSPGPPEPVRSAPARASAPVAGASGPVARASRPVDPGAGTPAIDRQAETGPESGPRSARTSVETRIGPDVVERAEHYRGQTRRLMLAGILIQFAVLLVLALYRGRPVRVALERVARRPVLGSAAVGLTLVLILTVVRLPLRMVAYDLGRDIGLVTQSRGDWLVDVAISTLISALVAAAAAMLAVVLWRRFGRRFWLAGSAFVAVWAVIAVWLWPVVVSPLFSRFEPLPQGPTRDEVQRLADRAGVDVGSIEEVDFSRKSSAVNAYVNGIGNTKRVVIYDNAIRKLSRPELSVLLAHELGHVRQNDVYRGLAFAILVIPLSVLFVQVGTVAVVRRSGDDPDGPGIVPALALMIALAALFISFPGNLLSRDIEAEADRQALELTSDPDAMVNLQVRLAWANISDPDPPGLYQFLFGSHPSTRDRIETAESWPKTGEPNRKNDSSILGPGMVGGG